MCGTVTQNRRQRSGKHRHGTGTARLPATVPPVVPTRPPRYGSRDEDQTGTPAARRLSGRPTERHVPPLLYSFDSQGKGAAVQGSKERGQAVAIGISCYSYPWGGGGGGAIRELSAVLRPTFITMSYFFRTWSVSTIS